MERLQQVGKSSIGESWGHEYQLMYDEIKENNFKIDLTTPDFMFQRHEKSNYNKLNNWNELTKKIVSI